MYVLARRLTDFPQERRRLQVLGDHVFVLDFPYALLWTTLLRKTGTFYHDSQRDLFRTLVLTDIPSFKEYCDAMKFTVMLEVLSLGFDLVYLDTDLALVADPMPYLLRGSADMAFSIEHKGCTYPTWIHGASPRGFRFWEGLEPNVGVIRLRATDHAIALLSSWTYLILNTNVKGSGCANGQKLFFHTKRWTGAQRTDDCTTSTPLSASLATHPTYCYLPELLFANGYMEFLCAMNMVGRNRQANKTALIEAYQRYGVTTNLSLGSAAVRTVYHPAILHFNFLYPTHKPAELEKKGFLLYSRANRSCLPFDLKTSYYAGNTL